MAQSLSKIHIRMNAFALPGRTTQHIHTIPRVSLCLPWAMRSLGFQPARFAPLTVSSACPLRLPWAMRSLGFAMHYWLHLSNSSMLDCIRFERSFSPFETKSETLVIPSSVSHARGIYLLDRFLLVATKLIDNCEGDRCPVVVNLHTVVLVALHGAGVV